MPLGKYFYNLYDESAEIREAVIHFELYRLLMNIISTKYDFSPIKYVWVHPEYVTNLGSPVDLVVDAKVEDKTLHFLVIEVKRKTKLGLEPFSDEAKQQAMRYAEILQAPYYAVTDGFNLLLFKNPDKEVGKYRIRLDETVIEKFLKELAEYHIGKRDRLDLPATKCPDDIIKKIGKEITNALYAVFEEVSNVEGLNVRCISRNVYLNYHLDVYEHRGIFRLCINPSNEEKSYVHIDLDKLRTILGNKFTECVSRLSEISGFNWVKERLSEQFTWRYVKDIATEEPNYLEVRERLKQWILEVRDFAQATYNI